MEQGRVLSSPTRFAQRLLVEQPSTGPPADNDGGQGASHAMPSLLPVDASAPRPAAAAAASTGGGRRGAAHVLYSYECSAGAQQPQRPSDDGAGPRDA